MGTELFPHSKRPSSLPSLHSYANNPNFRSRVAFNIEVQLLNVSVEKANQ
jgi:hypothetical protein